MMTRKRWRESFLNNFRTPVGAGARHVGAGGNGVGLGNGHGGAGGVQVGGDAGVLARGIEIGQVQQGGLGGGGLEGRVHDGGCGVGRRRAQPVTIVAASGSVPFRGAATWGLMRHPGARTR